MAELLRIEPSKFRKDEAWFVFDNGRQYLRKVDQEPRKVVNFPAIMRDSIDPIRGADGKMYDSLAAYRRTLLPENNPRGERFIEIGNEEVKAAPAPQFDRAQRRDDIRAAIADVKAGKPIPAPVVLED